MYVIFFYLVKAEIKHNKMLTAANLEDGLYTFVI